MPIQRIPFFFSNPYQQTSGTGAYRNPWQGWRKVSANDPALNCPCSDLQNQEVFNEPASVGQTILDCLSNPSNCNTGSCCPSRTRQQKIQNKNGVINRNYNHSYGQYLRRKCKGFYSKSFHHNLNTTTHLGAPQCSNSNTCFGDVCSPAPTIYKPNNAKYSQQGAVSSSERLLRLKTTMKQGCASPNPCWTIKTYPQGNCFCHFSQHHASCCK